MQWKGIGRRLRELFQHQELDENFYLELEDAMIEADMGVRIASRLWQRFAMLRARRESAAGRRFWLA